MSIIERLRLNRIYGIMKNGILYGLVAAMGISLLTGCIYYGNDTHRTTGRVIDDKMITGKVREALRESPVYKFPHVNVATFNGVVQLSGFVVRDEQKAEASELARRVAGVTEVINNISLAPVDQRPGPDTRPYVDPRFPRGTNVAPRGS